MPREDHCRGRRRTRGLDVLLDQRGGVELVVNVRTPRHRGGLGAKVIRPRGYSRADDAGWFSPSVVATQHTGAAVGDEDGDSSEGGTADGAVAHAEGECVDAEEAGVGRVG